MATFPPPPSNAQCCRYKMLSVCPPDVTVTLDLDGQRPAGSTAAGGTLVARWAQRLPSLLCFPFSVTRPYRSRSWCVGPSSVRRGAGPPRPWLGPRPSSCSSLAGPGPWAGDACARLRPPSAAALQAHLCECQRGDLAPSSPDWRGRWSGTSCHPRARNSKAARVRALAFLGPSLPV